MLRCLRLRLSECAATERLWRNVVSEERIQFGRYVPAQKAELRRMRTKLLSAEGAARLLLEGGEGSGGAAGEVAARRVLRCLRHHISECAAAERLWRNVMSEERIQFGHCMAAQKAELSRKELLGAEGAARLLLEGGARREFLLQRMRFRW